MWKITSPCLYCIGLVPGKIKNMTFTICKLNEFSLHKMYYSMVELKKIGHCNINPMQIC